MNPKKEFKLVEVKKKDVLVLGYFNEKPFTGELRFKKNQTAEFLFKDA